MPVMWARISKRTSRYNNQNLGRETHEPKSFLNMTRLSCHVLEPLHHMVKTVPNVTGARTEQQGSALPARRRGVSRVGFGLTTAPRSVSSGLTGTVFPGHKALYGHHGHARIRAMRSSEAMDSQRSMSSAAMGVRWILNRRLSGSARSNATWRYAGFDRRTLDNL